MESTQEQKGDDKVMDLNVFNIDDKKISFKVVSPIVAKQRPKVTTFGGHARAYTPKETTNYENLIKMSYKEQCDNYSFGDKPVVVEIVAVYGLTKELEKYGDLADGLPKTSKADIDNICKSVLDGLNGVAMKDDSQVAAIKANKIYMGNQDFIYVTISNYPYNLDVLKQMYKFVKTEEKYNKLKTKTKLTKEQQSFVEDFERMIHTDGK